jgi:hypothetical protein
MKTNNIDTQNQGCCIMEKDSNLSGLNSIKDIWNRLPLVMKIGIVLADLFVLGFLIYYFNS